jgi:hypothetical protein
VEAPAKCEPALIDARRTFLVVQKKKAKEGFDF